MIINTELPRRHNGRQIKYLPEIFFFILRFEDGRGNDMSVFCSALSGTLVWPQQNKSCVHMSLLSYSLQPIMMSASTDHGWALLQLSWHVSPKC